MNLPKFLNKFKPDLSERKKYWLTYTVCFIIMAVLVNIWYIAADRTLIWREDGWLQHYKALVYYSKYLRSIIKNLLLEHQLVIPNWDFAIGEGSDILATLHYYTIGDPLSVFSVFFSEENMYIYYDAAIVLRMFFSGITFSVLCFGTGRKNPYAVLAGSMSYAFCGWMLYFIRHPFFLNPMIYFPLLILGIEKILSKKRPYLFIISVAVSAMCNFYFFYMLALACVIYTITRLIILYRSDIKEAALRLLKIGIASVLGVILAAVIFLPIIYVFIGDSRISEDVGFHIFYNLSYYTKLPRMFVSPINIYSAYMAFSIPILPAAALMYYKRKNHTLTKSLFAICMIIVSFPIFGRIFNGFAYVNNRWIWAFALLCAYILVMMWPELMNLNTKEAGFLFKFIAIYFALCMFLEYSRTENVFAQLFIACALLFILFPLSSSSHFTLKRKQQLTLMIALISIVLNSFYKNAPEEGNEATAYLQKNQVVLHANETVTVANTAASEGKEDFYRYSGRGLTENANMIAKISSTQYFWSLINPYIEEYRRRLDILENRSFDPSNYDDRAGLNSLASVYYYSVPQGDASPSPYGFSYAASSNGPAWEPAYTIYRNDNSLPLTYTYDSYMDESNWDKLSTAAKEEAMLQTAVLSKSPLYTARTEPEISSYDLPFDINCDDSEVTYKDNTFTVTSAGASAVITFEGTPKSETFLTVNGMQFKETPMYDLYFGDASYDPNDLYNNDRWQSLDYVTQKNIKKDKFYWSDMEHEKTAIILQSSANETKTLQYYTNDYSFYSGRHDFAACFLADEEGLSSIKLSFNLPGVYSFDSINVICQPMNNYVNQINKLKETTLENINISTDTVTGNITLDSPSLLCFSIPYSKGWQAYVDGNKAKIYQANIMHMALDLDAGSHEIKLVYKTPLLREGLCISIIGLVIFITLIIVNEKRLKKNR